jgi:hypothetical protein
MYFEKVEGEKENPCTSPWSRPVQLERPGRQKCGVSGGCDLGTDPCS